jgi:hypothetical protein
VQPHRCTNRQKERNMRRAFGAAIGTAVGSGPARPAPLLVLNEVRLAKCGAEEAISLREAPRRTTCGGCGGERLLVGISSSGAESLSLRAAINKDAVVGALSQSVGRAKRAEPIAQRQDLTEILQ